MTKGSTWDSELDIWKGPHLLGDRGLGHPPAPKAVLCDLLCQFHPLDNPKTPCS